MKLDFCLLADAASAFDGKLYIHGGGLTRLTPPVIPWTHPQMAFLARFRLESEDAETDRQFTLRVVRPNGEKLAEAPFTGGAEPLPPLFEGEEAFRTVILGLGGLVFEQEGTYRVELDVDGALVRSLPLPVSVVPQPGFTAQEEGPAAS